MRGCGAASGDDMPVVAVVDGVKIAFYANDILRRTFTPSLPSIAP